MTETLESNSKPDLLMCLPPPRTILSIVLVLPDPDAEAPTGLAHGVIDRAEEADLWAATSVRATKGNVVTRKMTLYGASLRSTNHAVL